MFRYRKGEIENENRDDGVKQCENLGVGTY